MAPSIATTTYTEARDGAKQYLNDRMKVTATSTGENFGIPLIDIGPSFSSVLEDRQKVADEIRYACMTSGFFYITSHGIPPIACEGILDQARHLFKDLPREKKEALHLKNSKYGYGWEPADATSLHGDAELKEGFNWSYEESLDPTGGDSEYVQLDGTRTTNVNQWPQSHDLPLFFEGVRQYYGPALQLARHLCRLFALSLNLPENHFDPMITHPNGNARLMYYPPNTNPSSEIGLGAHSDYQCFTILLCSCTPGLEILSPSGQWITAPAEPITVQNALIVNVGDMMMRWTNDLYRSTVHRVVNKTADERYSVPLFFGINNDQIVETLPSCVNGSNPPKYAPIRAGEYVLQRLATTRLPEVPSTHKQ